MLIRAKLLLATGSFAKLSEVMLHLKMWQLVLSLFQLLSATPDIVFERNMFAYYKLPLKMLDIETKHTNKSLSKLYYVLQCPTKLNDRYNNRPIQGHLAV